MEDEKVKKKLDKNQKGRIPWNKGKKLSKEHKLHIKQNHFKYHSEKTKKKIGAANSLALKGRFGPLCNSWKGGKTKLDKLIRESLKYREWISYCMTRDNWTCRTCSKRGGIELQVHHIKPLSLLIKENNIKTIQNALNCYELWDTSNGVSLCLECHKQTDTYCGRMFKKLKGGGK